jgi:single-strand DNA-binding protein
MNVVMLIGRLTRDPELRYTQSGMAVCNFTLAVDRPFTSQSGEREADFIDIVVWNKPAENVSKFMSKGRQVAVEGRLQIRSYDGNDGQRHWRTEVVANRVEFLGGGGNGGGQSSYGGNDNASYGGGRQQPRNGSGYGQQQRPASNLNNIGTEVSFSDEDLPF